MRAGRTNDRLSVLLRDVGEVVLVARELVAGGLRSSSSFEKKQTRGEVLPAFGVPVAWVRSDADLPRVEVIGDGIASNFGNRAPRDLDSVPGDEDDRAQPSDRVVRNGCRRRRAVGDDASLLVRPDRVAVDRAGAAVREVDADPMLATVKGLVADVMDARAFDRN